MSIVIEVENVSKQYRLGQIGTGSLSHDVNRFWHKVRGKEDPYLKIGAENDRTKKGDSDYVWALKDINFTVEQGKVLGIIGRNGAGKSTLLKILSRTTGPTTGTIRGRGRIASLLEVGTGFHPELSGRDNIFLNGAILGMTKQEIRSKFDEIVDFSGVERYIDTPVKRYSSGMYVRLAFAVAAHLEPEILIVDEVLAVGDFEFQKKCLGKMKDVSVKDGRTVLFVSHNMGAVKNLCDKGLLLENGQMKSFGDINTVMQNYFKKGDATEGVFFSDKLEKSEVVAIKSLKLLNQNGIVTETFDIGDDLTVELELESDMDIENPNIAVGIKSQHGFITIANSMFDGTRPPNLKKGLNYVSITFKDIPLLPQQYFLGIGMRSYDCKTFLMTTKDIGFFAINTTMKDLGIFSPMAEEMVRDSVTPFIPYEWDFGNGNKQSFNILSNVRK
ncbi:MAG: ABC transporter ATP-binding protein [Bacteroidota bacterium]